jgi:hypothetical protein
MPRRAKHPDQMTGHSKGRAGYGADVKASMTRVVRDPVAQPKLDVLLGKYNPMTGDNWRPQTRALWAELKNFPTTMNLQRAQWMVLARAVAVDDASMTDPKLCAEARIRLSQFGVTPDELLKMRIQIVAADEAERRGRVPSDAPPRKAASARIGPHLRAVQ